MTDMRPEWLPQGGRAAHNVCALGFRVALMSPSSSGADAQLSLLEGDCVGLTWPSLMPGSHEPGFFPFTVSALPVPSLTNVTANLIPAWFLPLVDRNRIGSITGK